MYSLLVRSRNKPIAVFMTKQIRAFIALGPIATVGHIKGLAKYLSDASDEEEVSIKHKHVFTGWLSRLHEAWLADRGIMLSTCLLVRPFTYLSVTKLWTRYVENNWANYDAS